MTEYVPPDDFGHLFATIDVIYLFLCVIILIIKKLIQ